MRTRSEDTMKKLAIAAFLGLGLLAMAQEKPVGLADDPTHKLILSNRTVQVYRVEIPVGGKTTLHRHDHDSLRITLDDSDSVDAIQGQAPAAAARKVGTTRWAKGGFTHQVTNKGATPLRGVTVELLEAGGPAKPATEPDSRYCNPGSQTACVDEHYLLCTDRICVEDVNFGPGAVTTRHTHTTDHMIIALTDLDMTDDAADRPSVRRQMKAGEASYFQAGLTHRLINGPQAARFIVVVWR
jgi:quercetin dioxygenase-like cupin family protein